MCEASNGGSSGAKVVLSQPANGNKGAVTVTIGEKTWTRDVAELLGRETPLEESPFVMRVEAYWPDFRIDNGKPVSVSEQPNNPAVVVTLRGRAVPAAAAPDAACPGAPQRSSDAESPNALHRR